MRQSILEAIRRVRRQRRQHTNVGYRPNPHQTRIQHLAQQESRPVPESLTAASYSTRDAWQADAEDAGCTIRMIDGAPVAVLSDGPDAQYVGWCPAPNRGYLDLRHPYKSAAAMTAAITEAYQWRLTHDTASCSNAPCHPHRTPTMNTKRESAVTSYFDRGGMHPSLDGIKVTIWTDDDKAYADACAIYQGLGAQATNLRDIEDGNRYGIQFDVVGGTGPDSKGDVASAPADYDNQPAVQPGEGKLPDNKPGKRLEAAQFKVGDKVRVTSRIPGAEDLQGKRGTITGGPHSRPDGDSYSVKVGSEDLRLMASELKADGKTEAEDYSGFQASDPAFNGCPTVYSDPGADGTYGVLVYDDEDYAAQQPELDPQEYGTSADGSEPWRAMILDADSDVEDNADFSDVDDAANWLWDKGHNISDVGLRCIRNMVAGGPFPIAEPQKTEAVRLEPADGYDLDNLAGAGVPDWGPIMVGHDGDDVLVLAMDDDGQIMVRWESADGKFSTDPECFPNTLDGYEQALARAQQMAKEPRPDENYGDMTEAGGGGEQLYDIHERELHVGDRVLVSKEYVQDTMTDQEFVIRGFDGETALLELPEPLALLTGGLELVDSDAGSVAETGGAPAQGQAGGPYAIPQKAWEEIPLSLWGPAQMYLKLADRGEDEQIALHKATNGATGTSTDQLRAWLRKHGAMPESAALIPGKG